MTTENKSDLLDDVSKINLSELDSKLENISKHELFEFAATCLKELYILGTSSNIQSIDILSEFTKIYENAINMVNPENVGFCGSTIDEIQNLSVKYINQFTFPNARMLDILFKFYNLSIKKEKDNTNSRYSR